jgi:hypothetical protein
MFTAQEDTPRINPGLLGRQPGHFDLLNAYSSTVGTLNPSTLIRGFAPTSSLVAYVAMTSRFSPGISSM